MDFDKIFDLNKDENCNSSCGGVTCFALIECDHVLDFVFETDITSPDYGCLINIVFDANGNQFHFLDSEDDTGQYNQSGARDGRKATVTQTGNITCEGLTKQSAQLANALIGECCFYGVAFHNNNISHLIGAEFDPETGGWKKSRNRLVATVDLNSNLGTAADVMTINFTATSSTYSPALLNHDKSWLEGL